MLLALVLLVVVLALAFDFTNGFHDAANAVATSISTRALSPRAALALTALLNLGGAFLGQEVALTIGSGIVSPPAGRAGLATVLAGLLGAIAWNVVTWWRGLPSSSTHALVGGLAGAALVSGAAVHWQVLASRVVVPMVLSPLVGLVAAFALMVALLWAFQHAAPGRVNRRFRWAQTVSAGAVALGHGLQDAQKTMGVIVLALVVGGAASPDDGVPVWVRAASAAAIALGTWSGGWRVIRTLGRRIVSLDPPSGFVAEAVAAGVLCVAAFALRAPVSTTHVVTAAVTGAGSTRGLGAVRWGVVRTVALGWLVTLPAAAAVAAVARLALRPLLG